MAPHLILISLFLWTDAEWAGSYDPIAAGPIWTWRPGMGCCGGLAGTAPGHEGTSSKKTCLKRCTAVPSGGDWLETGIGGTFQALVDRFPRPGGNRSWGRRHPGCLATGPLSATGGRMLLVWRAGFSAPTWSTTRLEFRDRK